MIPSLVAHIATHPLAMLFPLLLLASACSEDKMTAQKAAPGVATEVSPKPSVAASAATAQPASADQFFINSKPQAPAVEARPEPKGDLTFTIDLLDLRDKVVRVRGWGFRITPPHQIGDRVTILLVGPAATYSVLADVESRPDVSSVLNRPGMDDTGFVSLIDTTGFEPGEYTLFLRVGGADGEATESTNQKLNL